MSQFRTKIMNPVNGLLLLGGGELLRKICTWSLIERFPVKVITSPRHAIEEESELVLEDFLRTNKISFLVVSDINNSSVADFLKDTDDYFYLSLGAAWIFKDNLIATLFDDKLFNLHGTRLPQDRGGGGFSWHIMMNHRFGFCVLHKVDGGIDTGDIVAYEEFIYPSSARLPVEFEKIYIEKNYIFIIDFINQSRNSARSLELIKQSEWFSTYWPRLNTKINGYIDWSMNTIEIERFICAFDDPYIGAATFLNEIKVHLRKVSISFQDGHFHPYQSGLIYRKGNGWICVASNSGTLIIEEINDETGLSLFNNVVIGDRLYTPNKYLENSRDRVIYSPKGLKL